MPSIIRIAPRYDMLFNNGEFNGTLLIGPDPLGANFDYKVFLEARRKLRLIGLKMTDSKRGLEEYQKTFSFNDKSIKARIQLVLGRNYRGNLQELWRETLAQEDLIYLKTHAGYGRHLSLSDDVSYFTDTMKKGSDHPRRKPYQLFYLDCCKSEMYYKEVLHDYVGDSIDLILHKWFCDYKIIGPVIVLIDELMKGSDFETIVSKMNDEYGIPHFDVEDKPEDMRLDRKMVTYSIA
ncbi:MAG: hypothetical protein ABOK23_06205 [Candidatus Methanoperedens sp.]|nr:hypothetical protein [Candidatus Methanoperedens sp.]MCZ7396591.1 hypothetical protein [Candidatus Methanoperedens sp.]